jgi:hypothetical protein
MCRGVHESLNAVLPPLNDIIIRLTTCTSAAFASVLFQSVNTKYYYIASGASYLSLEFGNLVQYREIQLWLLTEALYSDNSFS